MYIKHSQLNLLGVCAACEASEVPSGDGEEWESGEPEEGRVEEERPGG